MIEVDHELNNHSQDWKRADARVLGQILAAQNILFVLPDEVRIAEYFSQALAGVPGITSCFVCLGDMSTSDGAYCEVCVECMTSRKKEGRTLRIPRNFDCRLADKKDLRIITVETHEHTFGFFIFGTDLSGDSEPYWPFLHNLANYVALSLENRMQKLLLEEARDELEDRVKKRTEELMIMNVKLENEIQERKTTEEALSKEKDRAQSYLDIAGVMLLGLNEIGHIVLINKKGCEVLEYQEEDLIGLNWFAACLPFAIRDAVKSDYLKIMSGQVDQLKQYENPVLTKSGDERIIEWRNSILKDKDGKIIGTFSSGEDITDRKITEEKIHKLNEELEQRVIQRTAQLEAANKELEAFAYSVSHDLRAPLRHIDGFLELLQNRIATILDEESKHYMATIFKSSKRMDMLIDDLLSFSRMGRIEMSKMQVNLNNLIREVILEIEPEVKGRNIKWQISDLPTIDGDHNMLRIVLVNLIMNALKFTRSRSQAEIEIGWMTNQENESIIFIRDNGVGFDMKYANKLFGVFQRLHRTDEFEGVGIGLANVKRIINRLGGKTWAEGEVNRGAIFYFSLP